MAEVFCAGVEGLLGWKIPVKSYFRVPKQADLTQRKQSRHEAVLRILEGEAGGKGVMIVPDAGVVQVEFEEGDDGAEEWIM